ncbi:hypothetical protein VP01_1108g2 [Puccinia sorghi]|uniref:Uncharacterized protein n=1 Tax=Puccinia sorghi TaxID=27349 RepID=A0A0L6VSY5_9BASI|nr:hypothetical protein VP01_1108g2 [Puccinia sorghi]
MKLKNIPIMGNIMAEVYNWPVFYYGKYWSQTFFPSTPLPNNNLLRTDRNPSFCGLEDEV